LHNNDVVGSVSVELYGSDFVQANPFLQKNPSDVYPRQSRLVASRQDWLKSLSMP
jgi:hypothetical protein